MHSIIIQAARLPPDRTASCVISTCCSEHSGTVVRWSVATALSKIILLNTPLNKELLPAAKAIVEWEQDNGVKKIYQKAVEKIKK